MRRAWQAGRTLRLFTDEFRSPILRPWLPRARSGNWPGSGRTGLYHVAGSETAVALADRPTPGRALAATASPHRAGSLNDYTGAPRAARHLAQLRKGQKLLSFRLPGLSEWLSAHADETFEPQRRTRTN